MVKDNVLKWFREEFIPNCGDDTIAAIMFLYRKYGKELKDPETKAFVEEKKNMYLNTPVKRD